MSRTMMLRSLATIGFTLFSGMAIAEEWGWAPEHEHGFYQRFTREPVRVPPPAGFHASVGAVIPEGVELYDAPADYDYAPVRAYRYTREGDHVVVVEPRTRRVVRIIER